MLDSNLNVKLDLKTEVLQAEQRIRPYIRQTPLDYSLAFSQDTGCQTFFKLENLQYTGSFKVRGAMSKLLSLSSEQRQQGIVAASSGNHGAALSFGLSQLKIPGIIFVPENVSPTKVEAIRRYGAEVRFYESDAGLTESYARAYAAEHQQLYISPYNDRQVIAGQGTIAVELAQQLQQIDAVFVSVGGGGLLSGVAGYLKAVLPAVKIIGCSPKNSPVMAASLQAGRIVEMESQPTLSDGTAGGVEPQAITFELCRSLIDDFVLVSESEIIDAMRRFMETHHQLIEGAAGVAIAALLKSQEQFRNQTVAVVLCGANISLETLTTVLSP